MKVYLSPPPDSVCVVPWGSPEEQVSLRLRHHQHARGLRQGRAPHEGVCVLQDFMESLESLLCVCPTGPDGEFRQPAVCVWLRKSQGVESLTTCVYSKLNRTD